MLDIDAEVEEILNNEDRQRKGAVTDDPADQGGLTKYGITLPVLSEFLRRPAAPNELSGLTLVDAKAIYRTLFVVQPGFSLIRDEDLAKLVIDCGVLHGRVRAAQWLQQAVKVPADGHIGPLTLSALDSLPPRAVFKSVLAARQVSIASFVQAKPAEAKFLPGWMARCNVFLMRL